MSESNGGDISMSSAERHEHLKVRPQLLHKNEATSTNHQKQGSQDEEANNSIFSEGSRMWDHEAENM